MSPNLNPDLRHVLSTMDRLTHWLDEAVTIPGTDIRVGIDVIIGLVPGVGDLVSLVVSTYLVYGAWLLGAPLPVLARMVVNLAVDAAVGTIPVVGDLIDAAFKVNRRNLDLVRDWLDRRAMREAFA